MAPLRPTSSPSTRAPVRCEPALRTLPPTRSTPCNTPTVRCSWAACSPPSTACHAPASRAWTRRACCDELRQLGHHRAYPNTGTKVFNTQLSHAGSKMLVEGAFTSVAGQARQQIFMLDLGSTAATVDAWTSNEFSQACNATPLVLRAWSELVTERRHRLHRDHRLQARIRPRSRPPIGARDCATSGRIPGYQRRGEPRLDDTPAATRTTPSPPTPITSTSVAMSAGPTTARLRQCRAGCTAASPRSARRWTGASWNPTRSLGYGVGPAAGDKCWALGSRRRLQRWQRPKMWRLHQPRWHLLLPLLTTRSFPY